ncbi:MAG: hypothetical protein ACK4VI_08785 [Alphaproteobacteria bacterium]
MVEPEFTPDYAYWWNKKDLTKEELVTLALGINPAAHEWANRPDKSNEAAEYFVEFYDYIERDTLYGDKFSGIRRHMLEKYWLDKSMDKHALVNILYELGSLFHCGLYMHPDFLMYLSSISEKPTHFDKYYNHGQYECGYDTILEKEEISEDEAIGLPFGFEHSFLIKFTEIAYKPWNKRTEEERFFCSQYTDFLKSQGIAFGAYQGLCDAVNNIKKKNLWQGDLQGFLNAVYDEGYIFHDSIVSKLKILPEYSQAGWAYKFYNYWLDQGVWTFEEAKALFRGTDPRNDEKGTPKRKEFNDFRFGQGNHVRGYYKTKDVDEEVLSTLEDKFERHCLAREIISEGNNIAGQKLFKPKEIVSWFLKNTEHNPPQPLLDLLEMHESREAKDQSATENKKAAEAQSKKRRSQLHDLIGNIILILGFKDKTAHAHEVWNYIRKHKESYDCLQEVTETEIIWCSYRGVEQKMKRERFNNVVSEYNTKKRNYPEAA